MIHLRWITPILGLPFRSERSLPLVRPDRMGWNPSLSLQTLQVETYRLCYVVKGVGEPVVLIHGYGAGMWVWEKQMEALAKYYQVFAVDLLGHGFSDRPKIEYTPETYVRSVKCFMEEVGIEKAVLIGNSMGGGIAWGMAVSFPERVKKLILIDATPPDVLDQVQNDSFRMLVETKDLPLFPYLLIASRNRGSIKGVLEECVSDRSLITREITDRAFQLLRVRGTTWVLASTFRHATEAMRFEESLSLIPHPTLVIWGEQDLIFPVRVGERLHRIIPRSILRTIPQSGHIPMWETPEAVNPLLLSFLREET
jgi:2-hydroxy-6-oxonona-2,4-dienedioate hydrolase